MMYNLISISFIIFFRMISTEKQKIVTGVTKATTDQVKAAKKEKSSPGMFFNTKWDPILEQAPFNKNYQSVLDIGGHYEEHLIDQGPDDSYGDINIMTLNLSSTISTEEMNQQSTLTIKQIYDHAHPSVLALQGIREPLMARLKKIMNSHYEMLNFKEFTKDNLSAANYYFPIIIDKKMFGVKNTGYFRNEKGTICASYAILKDIKRDNKIFTVINMDLYSTFRGMVEGQFINFIADIKGAKEVNDHPVFFAGGMGALSENILTLFSSGYKNLVDLDNHNQDLDKTTVHGKVEHSDNIQRDFIILRDPNSVFTLNYARILSNNFPVGEHYPVQAILSYT